MKLEIEYDLASETVTLRTPVSHREFRAVRGWTCRECGVVNNNPLIQVLRAIAMLEASPAKPDSMDAVLAYDLEEILKLMGYEAPKRTFTRPASLKVGDGSVTVRTVTTYRGRKAVPSIEELGDLDD